MTPATAVAPVALSPQERDAMALALAAGFTSAVATLPPSDGRRWWKVLATDSFDAWVIDWPTDTSVDPHDHGGSAASISVVRGALREVLLEGDGTSTSVIVPGGVHRVAADAVHDEVAQRLGQPGLAGDGLELQRIVAAVAREAIAAGDDLVVTADD